MNPTALRWSTRTLILLAGALLFVHSGNSQEPKPLTPLTVEQQEKLKERSRLAAEAQKLATAGKFAEAVGLMERSVALHREVKGKDDLSCINSLIFIAEVQEVRDDLAGARKARQDVFDTLVRVLGRENWWVKDAQRALADMDRLEKMSAADRRRLSEARQMSRQIDPLYQQGKLREAVVLAEKTLAIRRELLGEKHPDYAVSMNSLAGLYAMLGDLAKAEPLYQQTLELRKQVLGETHPDYASSLNNLGWLFETQGNYAKAEPLYRRALEIQKQVFGDKHPRYAGPLSNLALLYKLQGEFAKAEPLYLAALAIHKQVGRRNKDYGNSLNNLGMLYLAQGNYPRAEPLLRQALEIFQELGDKYHSAYSLNNLAELYQLQGDCAKAEPLLRQALELRKQMLGEQHASYADTLNSLAALCTRQGDLDKAEAPLGQALEIYKRLGEQHPRYVHALGNLAELLRAKEDYAKAEPAFRRALELQKQVLGEKHPFYASSLLGLARLYQQQEEYDRAEPLFRQVLELRKQMLGDKHPDYADGLRHLAVLYFVQGKYARAEPLLRQAVVLSRDHLDLAAAGQSERQQLLMAAHFRLRLDLYLSVARAAGLSGSAVYEPILHWKGAVTVRQQRLRLERRDPELAAELRSVSSRLAALALATPEPRHRDAFQQQILMLSERKEQLERDLAQKSAGSRQEQELARMTPERLQQSLPPGTVLVDFREYFHATADPKNKEQLTSRLRLTAFVIPAARGASKGTDIVQLDLGPVKPIDDAIDKWRQTLATRTRPLENDQDSAAVLRQRLWQPLEPYVKDAQTVLVSPAGLVGSIPLGALPGSKPGTFLIEETTLVIVAVPQLLPALVAPAPVANAPGSPNSPKASLLLVGDVDYGADAALADARSREAVLPAGERQKVSWARLPASKTEIQAIGDTFRRHLPDGTALVLQGGQASETAVRQQAPKHRYLHLATHGFFSHGYFADPKLSAALIPEEQALSGQFGRDGFAGAHPGLLSGLVLAGANRPVQPDRDDGILTALEVAELDLQNVELAVLSACETGLGALSNGEGGVVGLQRAFQVAGARNVITSLWKVDDDATAALMALFYHKLWQEKKAPLVALREAQLTLLHHPERVACLSRERGPNFDKVIQLPATPPKDAKPGTQAPVKLWASFVLSGAGQ
jgi:CHAT domain-containing protein/Tfp pilus assembly protein PilF